MKATLFTSLALLTSHASAIVILYLASEPNNQGERKTWAVDRGACRDLATECFDNRASWAFVDRTGLGNGCYLYE